MSIEHNQLSSKQRLDRLEEICIRQNKLVEELLAGFRVTWLTAATRMLNGFTQGTGFCLAVALCLLLFITIHSIVWSH